MPIIKTVILVVMGVSGSGKTTIATLLAHRLGWPFEEGDSLHAQSSIDKMTAGNPLTDDDRAPWLEKVAGWANERLDAGGSGVITCSALKRSYRDVINRRGSGIIFVFLRASKQSIAARLASRHGHFMPPTLLASQFADLEEPSSDECAVQVDAGLEPDVVVQHILELIGLCD